MIEKSEHSTVVTGDDITILRVMTVRRGLILKIDTGLNLTRISGLSIAQRDGITTARTNRAALRDINAWLVEQGVPAAWSKTYPNG